MSKLLSTLVAASMIGAFSLSAVAADAATHTAMLEKPAAAPHAAAKEKKAAKHLAEKKAESKTEPGKK